MFDAPERNIFYHLSGIDLPRIIFPSNYWQEIQTKECQWTCVVYLILLSECKRPQCACVLSTECITPPKDSHPELINIVSHASENPLTSFDIEVKDWVKETEEE